MEVSAEEPTTPSVAISGPVEEPNVPPKQHEEKGKGEALCSGLPRWMHIMYPDQLVTSARQTPLPLN